MKHENPFAKLRCSSAGFSLIELMVTLSVLAIIMALAAPDMRDWIGKARVRASVEALQNGVRLAQSEAVKRNRLVEFSLVTAAYPVADSSGFNNDAVTDNGTSWVVRVLPTGSEPPGNKLLLQGDAFSERGILLAGGNNKQLIFGGTGQIYSDVPSPSVPSPLLNGTRVYRVFSSEGRYPMCVYVRAGGSVRWCDPALSSGDLKCPTDISCPASP